MREIILGRQLSRIEQRLDRLEHFFESPQLRQLMADSAASQGC
jgi:hypothetical protein